MKLFKYSVSWVAYRASGESQQSDVICPISLLPLFCEPVHRLTTIKNSFSVIKSAVDQLHSRQTPVIAFGQPLHSLIGKASPMEQTCGHV